MLTLFNSHKMPISVIVHSIYYDKCPSYMHANFKKLSTVHNHNTRDSTYNFFVPSVNSITKTTFYYNGIRHWNLLPDRIKAIKCKNSFKIEVKKYFREWAIARENDLFVYY